MDEAGKGKGALERILITISKQKSDFTSTFGDMPPSGDFVMGRSSISPLVADTEPFCFQQIPMWKKS
jgi:hypothetical protein